MLSKIAFSVCSLGAIAVAGHHASSIAPIVNTKTVPAGLEAHETHAAASLLGQFRTSASSWLWLKSDLYLHNGVELRAQTDAEIAAGEAQIRDGDGWHQAIGDEVRHVTSIPSKTKDFRGWFGDIERATQAYNDMEGHKHVEPKSVLPLFRLMTWLDPEFLPGWTVGATLIANQRNRGAVARAIEYLNEGLSSNPESVAIRVEIARLQISREGAIAKSVLLLQEACRLGKIQGADPLSDEGEGILDAFRWLCLCYRELGKFELSVSTANDGLKLFHDDTFLMRMAKPAAGIWIEESQKEYYGEAVATKGSHGESQSTSDERKTQLEHDHHDH